MSKFDDMGQGPGRDPSSGEVGVLLCWRCPLQSYFDMPWSYPNDFSHDEAEVSDNTPREHVYVMGEMQHKGRSVAPGMGLRDGASLRRAHAYKMRAASSFATKGFTRSFCSIQFALLVLFSQRRRSGRQASSDLSRF